MTLLQAVVTLLVYSNSLALLSVVYFCFEDTNFHMTGQWILRNSYMNKPAPGLESSKFFILISPQLITHFTQQCYALCLYSMTNVTIISGEGNVGDHKSRRWDLLPSCVVQQKRIFVEKRDCNTLDA